MYVVGKEKLKNLCCKVADIAEHVQINSRMVVEYLIVWVIIKEYSEESHSTSEHQERNQWVNEIMN